MQQTGLRMLIAAVLVSAAWPLSELARAGGPIKVESVTIPSPKSSSGTSRRGTSSRGNSAGRTSSGKFNIDRSRAAGPGKKANSKSHQKARPKAKRSRKSKRKLARPSPKRPTKRRVKVRATSKRKTLKSQAQILVTTKIHAAKLSELAANNNLSILNTRFSNLLQSSIVLLSIKDGRSVDKVVAKVAALPEVDAAAPNHSYDLQGSDYDKVRFAPRLVKLDSIDATRTGKNVRIAVIDTAVDERHPALVGAIRDRFNGLSDVPIKQRRHGTAVAGLIAGRGMLTGAAPQAQLLIARGFDGSSARKLSTKAYVLLSCLDWSVDQRAAIVNMSFAGPPNQLLGRALAAAQDQGVVLVAAAGNNGPKAGPAYPAAYPSTIAVTATDARNRIYSGANQGDYIFMSAPGVDVLAPTPGKAIEVVSGTSFSAALLSGVIALELERAPLRTVREWRERLRRASVDLGPHGRDRIYGHGLIDAAQLLAR